MRVQALQARMVRKLGNCPFCMRTSALSTVVSWLSVIVLLLAQVDRGLAFVAGIVALAFNILFTAHVIAFWRRLARSLMITTGSGGDPLWSRREFTRMMLRLLIRYMAAPAANGSH